MRPRIGLPCSCAFAALLGSVLSWLSAPGDHRNGKTDTSGARQATSSTFRAEAPAPADDSESSASAPTTVEPWDKRWETAAAAPSVPSRTRALAALLEELAHTDPQRALALAAGQTDWRLRGLFRDSALRGWASVDPEAAGDHALAARPEDRRALVAAVLQGAAAQPASAVELALRLCAADPGPAGDYGHAAIAALVDAGAFAAAADFGARAGVEERPYLFKSAYFEWARHDPAAAYAAAGKLEDPLLASQARSQAIFGWAWADAAGLARHAITLPSGPERRQALADALPLWLEREPAVAAAWIQENENGADFDAGIVALANQRDLLASDPASSLSLAAGLSDPAERSATLRTVFRQWAERDPAKAHAYLSSTTNAADRAALSAEYADLFPDGRP